MGTPVRGVTAMTMYVIKAMPVHINFIERGSPHGLANFRENSGGRLYEIFHCAHFIRPRATFFLDHL